MVTRQFKTLEKCDECGSELWFLVEDKEVGYGDEMYIYGYYICPSCGYEEEGSMMI
jgi:C4-type Zn-finger protein